MTETRAAKGDVGDGVTTHRISVSAPVRAPAAEVYSVIADYRDGHARIVPPRVFTSVEVEHGGYGAGTEIKVGMRVFGFRRSFRAFITEPEPGRVLRETDRASGTVTTFTVEPEDAAGTTMVTIDTAIPGRAGLFGAIERRMISNLLTPLYREELERLAAHVTAGPRIAGVGVGAR
ncbi:MAG: Polyketide cyclase / dehydrase and lipid transport [Gemmatimonadetes bacterium]|nr:Polyketide cyclase / dehydrase and lipid transport [Gemmatimonadota bacterium]